VPAEAEDAELIARVTDVVNRAYSQAEADLWTKDIPRTVDADTAVRVRRGATVVARSDAAIIGAVRSRALDPATWWLGALGVDPSHAGLGVGSALVCFVEDHASAAGARAMRLDVLEADPPLEHLMRLTAWYEHRGYREIGRARVADRYPEDAFALTRPCDIVEMSRDLGA